MKTKKLFLRLAIAGLTLATFNSCKKNVTEIEAIQNERISAKNGMLHFKSQGDFDATMLKLQGMSLTQVDSWISNYGIKSLALDTIGGKAPVVDIANPVFARLLNQDASVIIGDKIFLLKGNNEYLVNNQNFDLYKEILSSNNYFQNNDKVYSKDVSANYKAIEISTPVNFKEKPNLASVNDGKIAVIEPDGRVTTSNETTYVSGAFQGTRYFYSQEFESTGRPERVYCAVTGQITIINTSYGLYMKGEVFRKGGAFGGKQWRDDAIAWGRIYNAANGGNYQGPATDTNFAYAFNLEHKTSLSIGWQYKKGYNDPTQTFIHNIVIQ